ncbi:MAG: hypothetical protein II304_02540 [Bacteroidales bacterium]|nr:hypothetical protein [Bacteroidales bacterium]
MELLLSLSKETSNSFAELMKMPMHITIGIYNALRKYLEKEAKARKEAEEKESARQSGFSAPSMPSFRMPSMPRF